MTIEELTDLKFKNYIKEEYPHINDDGIKLAEKYFYKGIKTAFKEITQHGDFKEWLSDLTADAAVNSYGESKLNMALTIENQILSEITEFGYIK